MLSKLLKYDLHREFKSLIPMYGVVLILPIIVRLMLFLKEQIAAFGSIATIVLVVYVIALIGLFFFTFFNSIKNFTSNILKDEGYLTNTLPVKKSSLIISKEITSLITISISVIIIIISIFCAFYDGTPIASLLNPIFDALDKMFLLYGMGTMEGYFYWILILVIGYLQYVMVFHLALILGHTRNANRIVFSIVFGIIIYFVIQVISMIGLGLDILINPNIIDSFEGVSFKDFTEAMKLVLYTQGIIIVITPIVTHVLSCKFLQTKLNLE